MPPKKKSVKKEPKAPKAPVGRPRKKLGTRVSDVPLVSTLRPRAARSNQDSMALQRARLQFKRDYPDDPKGIDEYKSRALLDAMADAARGPIGSRVLGESYYKIKDREDKRVKKLLAAQKAGEPVAIADGKVYVNKKIAKNAIGTILSNVLAQAAAGPSSAAPAISAAPIYPAVKGKPDDASDGTQDPNTQSRKRRRAVRARLQGIAQGAIGQAEMEAAKQKRKDDEADLLRAKITSINEALRGSLEPERRTRYVRDLRDARKQLKELVPSLTDSENDQVLNVAYAFTAPELTQSDASVIASSRDASPVVQQAIVDALDKLSPNFTDKTKLDTISTLQRILRKNLKKVKEEASQAPPPLPVIPLSDQAAALQKTIDNMGKVAEQYKALDLDAEAARQGYPLFPTEAELAGQRAMEQIEIQKARPTKKQIAEYSKQIAAQLQAEKEDVPLFNPRQQASPAAPPPPPRPPRPPPPPKKTEVSSTEAARIREVNRLAEEASAQEEQVRQENPLSKALQERALKLAKAETRPLLGPKIANEDPLSKALRERALKLVKAETKEGRIERNTDPLSKALQERALNLAKAETRPLLGPKVMNEDPLSKALQEQALKIKQKMIDKALKEEADARGVSAADAARLLEEEAESMRLLPPPAYEELFRDTASGTTAYQVAGEKYRPTAVFRTDPNPISRDVEKRFRYNKPMQNIFKDSPGKFKEVYARPYVPALSDEERAAVGDRDRPIQQDEMLPSTSDRILVPGTYRPALDDHPGPSVEAYGEGLVGGRRGRRSFTGGVLSRLRGMGYFDGFDSLMYNIHGTPDDNKKDLADAKAAYAARGGAMGGRMNDDRTDFRVLMDAMKTIRKPNGGAMGGSIVLSGVPTPMRGSGADADEYKLHYVAFPDDKWTTSSSLRWIRSNGIVPIKKAMHIPEYYKYQILPPSDNKDYMGHELVSRGRKILLGYARPSK